MTALLSTTALADTSSMNSSIAGMGILQNDYVKAGVNGTSGSFGSGGSVRPGLQYDSDGTGTFLGPYARSGRTYLVCRSLQLGADDDRCVARASKWLALRVDEIGYLLGDPRPLLFPNLHPQSWQSNIYCQLVALRGIWHAFPVSNYSSDIGKKWRLSFVFFFS